jgi:hypothetical protein
MPASPRLWTSPPLGSPWSRIDPDTLRQSILPHWVVTPLTSDPFADDHMLPRLSNAILVWSISLCAGFACFRSNNHINPFFGDVSAPHEKTAKSDLSLIYLSGRTVYARLYAKRRQDCYSDGIWTVSDRQVSPQRGIRRAPDRRETESTVSWRSLSTPYGPILDYGSAMRLRRLSWRTPNGKTIGRASHGQNSRTIRSKSIWIDAVDRWNSPSLAFYGPEAFTWESSFSILPFTLGSALVDAGIERTTTWVCERDNSDSERSGSGWLASSCHGGRVLVLFVLLSTRNKDRHPRWRRYAT